MPITSVLKRLSFFLLLSSFCLTTKAQQSTLLNETWFLTKILEDNVEFYTPEPWENFTNATLQFIPFETEGNMFSAAICGHELQMEVLTINENQFTCEYMGETLTECAPYIPYYQEYENKYINFWRDYIDGAKNPFNYEITNVNNALALVVTNTEGNKTYYSNTELSISDYSSSSIVYYPNPIQNKLIIENPSKTITSIKITDVSGKLIFSSQNISSTKIEIDFTPFKKGVYFITTEVDRKILKTEKLLKK